MASVGPPQFPSTKETTNYARLCRVLVDVGSQVLRGTFDNIHPPVRLHGVLNSHSVKVKLQSLYTGKKKVLNPSQWGKLYPAHTPVSSAEFDITLLTVLLRNICGLSTPAAGWDCLPTATDKNTEDDIARVKYYRNTLYGHASQASIDDASFNTHWQEIRDALVRLGGASFGNTIDQLKIECMDPYSEKHYVKLLKQWKKEDDIIKDKLEEMRDTIKENLKQIQSELKSEVGGITEKLETFRKASSTEEEDNIRDDLEQIRTEIGNVSEKLDTLKMSATKDEGNIKDKLDQIKEEIEILKEQLDVLRTERVESKNEGLFDSTEVIRGIRQLYTIREGWLAPFPWCEEFHFHLNDIFTRLKMVSRKKTRGATTSNIVEMSAIFQPHEECPKPRTVLIEGKPGMGKTTYCNKVAYDWATKKCETADYLPEVKVVLLLRCRDIDSDLWKAIDDQLLPRDIHEKERENFFEYIRQNQSNVLLVLDGLDELPSNKLPEFSEIIQGRMFLRCPVVVTARHEAGIQVRKVCDALLEIEGFTTLDAKDFIVKFFKEKEGDLAQKLLHKLDDDTNLEELIANPLNTALLCLIYEEFQGKFPESRTQLYLEIVQCVLRRYRKKKGLAINMDLIEVYKTELKHLGSIALNGLREDNMYFTDKQLGEHMSELPGFGFLSVQPGSSKLRPCTCYGFLHKSFQEFFAAYFLCCQLLNGEISPESLAADKKYFRELKQVLLFTCGILATQSVEKAVALINSIATQFNRYDFPVGIDDDFCFALECIVESKREQSDFHVFLARTFGSLLCLRSVVVDKILSHDQVAVLAEALKTNTTLTCLYLSDNKVYDAEVAALGKALKTNTTLTELDLSANYLSAAGAAALAEALKTNTTLTKLNLSDNDLDAAGAAALAEALKANTTLTKLNLYNNDLDAAGAAALAEALKANTTLTKLNLSDNDLDAAGAAALAEALKANTTLTKLNLSDNDLDAAGAAALAEALKTNTTLTELDLFNSNPDAAGAAALAEALKTNTTLTKLSFSLSYIDPWDLIANTTLTWLDFSDKNLNAAGAAALADALNVNTTLSMLYLCKYDFSQSVVNELKKAHGSRITFCGPFGRKFKPLEPFFRLQSPLHFEESNKTNAQCEK